MQFFAMWTALMLMCLASTLEFSVARNPHEEKLLEEQRYSVEPNPGNVRDTETSVRLSRRFFDDDNHKAFRRLHIKNQTGFDGKVRRIYANSGEDAPGIRAYGLPKEILENNGIIERVASPESRIDDDARNGRLVEAYGLPKEHLEDNGRIERIVPAVVLRNGRPHDKETRVPRSINTESENEMGKNPEAELDDLEAQDAKVFRPLFVYRRQQAERQRRIHAKNQIHGSYYPTNQKPYNDHRPVY